MSDFAEIGILARLQADEVKICPTCIALRIGIEALIGTEDEPWQAPDFVVAPMLTCWQQHKDQAHPAWSAYLRRTT